MDREKASLTPVEMVVREISSAGSILSEDQLLLAIQDVLLQLMEESLGEMERDPHSQSAIESVNRYLAISQMVAVFGTSLKAWEDMEEHDIGRSN